MSAAAARKPCAHCGTNYQPSRTFRIYCSIACRVAHYTDRSRELWALRGGHVVGPPAPKQCAYPDCTTTFIPHNKGRSRRYCTPHSAAAMRHGHRQHNRIAHETSHRQYYVYLWRDADGTPAYVGKGYGQRFLWHSHKVNGNQTSQWWTPDMTVRIQPAIDDAHAMELEGRWIRRYRPLHNREGMRKFNAKH